MRLSVLSFAVVGLVAATPVRRWYPNSLGANYFATNGFEGNQLVSSYIMPNGSLQAGTASWTYGNGSAGINDPMPYMNHPDPFYGDGSVIVANNTVMVVNAGSNTFSVFDIDPEDPARPTFRCTYPSGRDFPVSLAASPDGSVVCVLGGGYGNGFSCYQTTCDPWAPIAGWDRNFGLNLTTPPHGPVGGGPSQMVFSSDLSWLYVAVKGRLPTDLNNPSGALQPGAIYAYAIGKDMSLAQTPKMIEAVLPFSIAEDLFVKGQYFLTDVSTGYETFSSATGDTVQGNIANQGAVCWTAQSRLTKNQYTIDIAGFSNISEIAVDPATLKGTVVATRQLGNNSAGTDNSIFHYGKVDWLYVNAVAYQSVHTFAITGTGQFDLIQTYNVGDMPAELVPTDGFSGQAVYYKSY